MKLAKFFKSVSAVTISVLTLSLIPANMAFAAELTYTYDTAPTTITAKSKNAVIGVQDTEALVVRSTKAVPSDLRVGLYDTDTGQLINGDRFLSTSDSDLLINSYIPSGTHHYQAVGMKNNYGNNMPSQLTNVINVYSKSNVVELTRDQIKLTLKSDSPDYEQMYGPMLSWTVDQKLNGTLDNSIYLFDMTMNRLVYDYHDSDGVTAQYNFGDAHTYQAFIGAPKIGLSVPDVQRVEDLDIFEAPSNVVSVSRRPWKVALNKSFWGDDMVQVNTIEGGGNYITYLVERATGNIIWDSDKDVPYDQVSNNGHGQDRSRIKAYVARPYKQNGGRSAAPEDTIPTVPAYTNLSQLTDIQATSDDYVQRLSGVATPLEIAGGSNPSEACGQSCHGDPVNTFTGEFFENNQDVTFAGSFLTPSITRSFSTTKRQEQGSLGYGWRTNYDMKIVSGSTANLTNTKQFNVIQENGSESSFYLQDNGVYEPAAKTNATLIKDANGDFVFTRDRNLVFRFNATGQLIKVSQYNQENVLTYVNGKLSTITDSKGNKLTYAYGTNGLVSTITANNGQSVSYVYNTTLNLTKATDAYGVVHDYTYDAQRRVKTLTDALGGVTTNTYDSSHRVLTQKDPLNHVLKFAYSGNTTTITYPDNNKVIEQYSTQGQLVTKTEKSGTATRMWSYSYDGHGNLVSVVNPDNTASTTIYDTYNKPVSVTDANGNTTRLTYDNRGNLLTVTDALNNVIQNVYDANDNLLSTTNPAGHKLSFTYDANKKVISAVDGRGNESGANPTDYSSTFTYTAKGFAEDTTNAVGNKTHKTYDLLGRPTKLITPNGYAQNANPNDYTTSIEYNSLGLPTKTIDPYNNETAVTYDAAGNILTSKAPDTSITKYTYDALGNLLTKTDAKNQVTSYEYDVMNRVTTITDANHNVSTIHYDAFGRVSDTVNALSQVTKQTWDLNDNLLTQTDANNNVTKYKNDFMGNPLAITTPSGAVTKYSYDKLNRVITITDPESKVTKTEYTVDGKIHKTIAADNSETLYDYDASGNLTTQTNALDAVQHWTYDTVGRKISYVDAEGQTTAYTYDLNGNVQTETTAGKTISYVYDRMNRLTKIDHKGTASDIVYTYDVNGYKATEQKGSEPVVTYAYNAIGQLMSRGPPNAMVTYEYTALGQISKMITATGRQVNYTYDVAGNMTTVNTPALGTVAYDHNNLNLTTKITYPNGVEENSVYDNENRLTSTELIKNTTSLYKKTQNYSLNGNIAQRNDPGQAPSTPRLEDFTYDPLNRLTNQKNNADSSSINDYGYNSVGDLTKVNASAQTFDATGKLLASGTKSFEYDAFGNRVKDSQTATQTVNHTYAWDTTNKLTTVNTPADSISVAYSYDVQGLLATRTSGTTNQSFAWDSNNSVPVMLSDGEYDYVYGEKNTPLAQIKLSDSSVTYLRTDLNGSVTASTDSNGGLLSTVAYSPYGTVLGSPVSKFGYAGEWTDPTTKLVYLRARWLDTSTGTFLSLDPISQMTNQAYGYTAGNPLQQIDPLGLCNVFAGDIFNIASDCYSFADTQTFQSITNFVAGFGDSASFSATNTIRDLYGFNNVVDTCSSEYKYGDKTQSAMVFVLPGGAVKNIGKKLAEEAAEDATRFAVKSSIRNEAGHITNKAIKGLAEKLGLKEYGRNPAAKNNMIFKDPKTNMFYTKDVDGHIGGTFKGAKQVKDLSSNSTRSGTYDEHLNLIGK